MNNIQEKNLNIIRGAACLMVVIYHAREIIWVGFSKYIENEKSLFDIDYIIAILLLPFSFGGLGVAVFFVLSGYLIHGAAWRKLEPISIKNFYKKRFIRIYPVLFFSLIGTFLCDFFSKSFSDGVYNINIDVWDFGCNLFALQGVLCRPYSSNGPLWSLAVEVQFYIFYPFLYLFRSKFGVKPTFALLILAACLGILLDRYYGIVTFLQYYIFWWFGGYTAEKVNTEFYFTKKSHILFLCFVAPMVAALYFVIAKSSYVSFVFGSLSTCIFIYRIQIFRFELMTSFFGDVLSFLSKFSYSIYVLHVPVLILFRAVFLGAHKSQYSSSILIAMVFCFVICYAFYFVVERFFLKIGAAK